ncbi:rod shape-determining protein RodA [Acinetobacter radioresistens]|jgi:rod shape determining protein RodA|uniref:Peptidoglycan glycosyltransferase MrdB n=2 Tax=Acinetobacter radioresistens TaxID=40216 RepID=A0A2T1J1F6_ACIRA|nr:MULTISPECIES: rod shape-determining protein RodA [Acinetobacter]AWV86732.1 rod shape-determining protein RodA [Acinetobacter radioresistens]EET81088.1 rod shape-determining protein RodA [Acinetobacter radioresistens SK82]EEY86861.1 rod shape-determining protein RodA [Acinetobacter radioresistens SH164]EJO35156.1 rod shape-determining protein RodA [Acinetobacter radioresistens WC-A-157]ENV84568.1 rod shape-determining protein RodA [Acinetobacter radioresistens NIPH 2130]
MSPSSQYKFLRQAPRDGLSTAMQPSRWQRLHIDPWLCLFLFLNALLGLTVLYSASAQDVGLVSKQAMSFGIGFIVMFTLAQIPPKVYQAFSPYFYIFGVLALLSVMIFGEVRMGAQRWIDIPGFGSVQPSEFMKIGMPMMIAWFLSRHPLPPSFKNVIISLVLIIVPFLLIAEQPDLGTSLLILASGLFVLFLSGLSWKLIGAAIGLMCMIIPLAWQFLLHDYQRQRVLTLLNPEADALGTGWNIIQSKTAIGSGGFFGKGFLQGTQSHLHFLPEGHTDFIIAAYSEEFGLIGVLILITLYFAIIFRVLQIGLNCFHNYGRLVAGTLGLSFFVYVFVNAGMVSGILPVVGVPLPFMSYGGTAIITLMATFGLVMSIHTHR